MANWTTAGSGNWSDIGNWDAPVPNSTTATATFTAPVAGSGTYLINLGATSFTVANLNIASSAAHLFAFYNGTVIMKAAGGTAAMTVGVSGGQMASSGILDLESATTLNVATGGTFALFGDVKGTGALTLSGAGALQMGHANVTRTGDTTIGSGFLFLSAINAAGSGALTVNGGQIEIYGANQSTGTLSGSGGSIDSNAGATLAVNQSFDGYYGGNLTGSLNLTKNGAGFLFLQSATSFTGAATINSGYLYAGDFNALAGTSVVTVGASGVLSLYGPTSGTYTIGGLAGAGQVGVGVASAATLSLTTGDGVFSGQLFDGFGTLALVKNGAGVTYLSGDSNSFSGGLTVNGGIVVMGAGGATGSAGTGTVTINGGIFGLFKSGDYTFANDVAGAATFEKNLSGKVTLTGDNSGFTGTLNVNGGTLVKGASTAFGAASSFNIFTGATADLAGYDTILHNLSGAGTLTSSNLGALPDLTLDNSVDTTFSGSLSAVGLGMDVFKTGSGKFTLSGTLTNVLSVEVDQGTVAVAGNGAPAANERVMSGATLDISGMNAATANLANLDLRSGGTLVLGGHSVTASAQQGAIAGTIAGGAGVDGLSLTLLPGYGLDLSHATFSNWTDGTDTIFVQALSGDSTIVGSSHSDSIYGANGNDSLSGGAGNDALQGGAGNDTLLGGAGIDVLVGESGNDSLNGGADGDYMYGGAGADTYVVDSSSDVIDETVGQPVDDGARDQVYAGSDFTLPQYVENLIMVGTGNFTGIGNNAANGLTGNSANNLLSALDGNDYLNGADGNDTLNGGNGNDALHGGDGNDSLDGGTGSDSLYGGAGADTYVVDSLGDVISETVDQAVDDGATDQVYASVSFTLGQNVESLFLTGTDNISGTGNAAANGLTGNSGNNVLSGLDGNDYLSGGDGNDTLLGGNANDELHGGGGNDSLNGGTGNDAMYGGAGADTYVVTDPGDIVSETVDQPVDDGAADLVYANISFILPQYVESLMLTGAGNISGTGNAAGNGLTGNSGNNVLSALDGNDYLNGAGGNDTLNGGNGNDALHGGDGNDSLNGGTGNDSLYGGAGADIYAVDSTGDVISETVDQAADDGAKDQVYASVSFNLPQYVENLFLTGTLNLNGTGNSAGNGLTGNSGNNLLSGLGGNDYLNGADGNDTLAGGAGNDVLIGGNGVDSFTFAAAGAANGVDTVSDFVHGTDVLLFTGADYGFAAGHVLTAAEFTTGSAAVGATAQFVWNSTTHTLYWDHDGSGSDAAVAIATFSGSPTLDLNDLHFA